MKEAIDKLLDDRMNLQPEQAKSSHQKTALSLPVIRDLDWLSSVVMEKKLPLNAQPKKLLAMIGQRRGLLVDDLKCDECQKENGPFTTCVIAKFPTKEGTEGRLVGSGQCMNCYFENGVCSFSMFAPTLFFFILI